MLNWLGRGLLLRAVVQELRGIRRELAGQRQALERLADQFAPALARTRSAQASAEEVADTGVSAFDPIEGGLVEDFIARTQRQTGHTPSGDEILTFLADEQTVTLHDRLRAREQEVRLAQSTRLAEAREGAAQ